MVCNGTMCWVDPWPTPFPPNAPADMSTIPVVQQPNEQPLSDLKNEGSFSFQELMVPATQACRPAGPAGTYAKTSQKHMPSRHFG